MALSNKLLCVVALLLVSAVVFAVGSSKRPLVIAHRGSSGVLPEHTVAAYQRAVADGADVIECDVTLSQDLVPVCLHEELLQKTTDVADRPEFVGRNRSITVPVANQQVRPVLCTHGTDISANSSLLGHWSATVIICCESRNVRF